ncbi:MAG: M23 family metallopeptidase [Candidatus Liberibacter ctenarytainae]|uniref:M23 family metallopeptidase n=1 Tax=Candidatus Liberibacter ctenarytainae TaxID=2020335 RepID=A0A937AEE9_9HYPH|nr:M23 family metallopeptidase [Candidatus Liberibacter ctenarytainae]
MMISMPSNCNADIEKILISFINMNNAYAPATYQDDHGLQYAPTNTSFFTTQMHLHDAKKPRDQIHNSMHLNHNDQKKSPPIENNFLKISLTAKVPFPILFPHIKKNIPLKCCIQKKQPINCTENPYFCKSLEKKNPNTKKLQIIQNRLKVKRIDNKYRLKKNPNLNRHLPKSPSNALKNGKQKSAEYLWPVTTKNVVNFLRNNNGIDILVPVNTPIKAAKDGIVIYVGHDLVELGNTILIRHNNGIVTVYSHVGTLYVQKDQQILQGRTIALSGTSDNTQKSKVHFELRKNAIAMDPLDFLDKKSYVNDKSDNSVHSMP